VSSGVIVAARAADPSVDISLTTGDVIHAINGVEVETIAALRSALDHLASNTAVVLQIERDGRLMFVSFELD
jgi:S1-C subfamily serine protease